MIANSRGSYSAYRHCRHCLERLRMRPNEDGQWVQASRVEWKNSAECEKNEEGHEPR